MPSYQKKNKAENAPQRALLPVALADLHDVTVNPVTLELTTKSWDPDDAIGWRASLEVDLPLRSCVATDYRNKN